MTNTDREFDIIFWGATGFTGRLVAEYMVRQYGIAKDSPDGSSAKGTVRWAIAGRSLSKLAQIAAQASANDADKIPQIIADADDPASLEALVVRARVICTTVGPYAIYGGGLVKACVQSGTHYCDLSGEVHWMAEMIRKYQIEAEGSGARIVHSCGFDSIPSDIGVHYLQNIMQQRHGNIAKEARYRLVKASGGMSGGTVASMMNMLEQIKADPSIADIMADPYSLNPSGMPGRADGPDQMKPAYDPYFKQWTAPFVMAGINTRVVRRSNALQGCPYGEDFRYNEAVLVGAGPGGYIKACLAAAATRLMMMLGATSPGRAVMRRFVPQPGEGPSRDAIENGCFRIEIMGLQPGDKSNTLTVGITGDRDPGYGATAKMLVESAMSLAVDDIDVGGGFWTPASAMGDHLLRRLEDNAGMRFTVLD